MSKNKGKDVPGGLSPRRESRKRKKDFNPEPTLNKVGQEKKIRPLKVSGKLPPRKGEIFPRLKGEESSNAPDLGNLPRKKSKTYPPVLEKKNNFPPLPELNLAGLIGEPKRRFARALSGRPTVTAVVINHNGADLLWNCLFALRTQTYPLDQIIVVDNDSTDSSLTFLEANYPQVRILECQENFGYALGCNLGARMAEGDLVVFLHNDTVATPEWISRMVETFREWGPDTGAVTSEVHARKGKGDPDRENAMNLLGLPLRGFYMDRDLRFFPAGCAFMIPRYLFPEGPYEGDYFLGGEDVQLGFRLQDGNHPVVAARGAKVFHGEGEKPFRLPGWKKEYFLFRNRYLTILTFYHGRTLFKLTPLFMADWLFNLLKGLFLSPERLAGMAAAAAWIFSHPGWLRKKRLEILSKRVEGDGYVLGKLSGRVLAGEGGGARVGNFLSLVYCCLARIPVLESADLPPSGKTAKNLENKGEVE
jgi:GT2 family glycosyltransferase